MEIVHDRRIVDPAEQAFVRLDEPVHVLAVVPIQRGGG